MTDTQLLEAQAARDEAIFDYDLDQVFDRVFSADTVGPEARAHLRGILKHYAKSPHPFRACVADNMKRFGPGRTEKVCATLKDMIRGTTHWRHQDGFAGSDLDLDPCIYTLSDNERSEILAALSDDDFAALEEVISNASEGR